MERDAERGEGSRDENSWRVRREVGHTEKRETEKKVKLNIPHLVD